MNTATLANPNPLLQMSGINKSFGATCALRDVALQVHAGAVMALSEKMGPAKVP